MKPRSGLALAMTAMIGATSFLAMNAFAQQQGAPPRGSERSVQRPAFSPEDRAAFFDARIAAIKAGLRLTPDQEKLWPAVESAVRDGFAKRAELRQKMQAQTRPADPVEAMRRMAEAATARGEMLGKIVAAAQPFYASLTDDQKRRLSILMHHSEGGRMGRMGPRFSDRFGGDDRGPAARRGMMDQQRPGGDPRGMMDQQRPGGDPRGMMGPRGNDDGRFGSPGRGNRGDTGQRDDYRL